MYKTAVANKVETTVESDPVLRSKKEIVEYYAPLIKDVEDEISDLRIKKNSKKTRAGRYAVEQQIKVKESRRSTLIRKRNRQLRKFDKGTTVGGSVAGTGLTVGN